MSMCANKIRSNNNDIQKNKKKLIKKINILTKYTKAVQTSHFINKYIYINIIYLAETVDAYKKKYAFLTLNLVVFLF